MADVLEDANGPERCPNCLHTINLDGLNDPDCPCYCHKAVDEMREWLSMIEERRDWRD